MTFYSPKRTRSPLGEFDESMTQQSDLPQSDIHNIMKRFERTGVIEHDAKYHGTYGDFTSMPDFKEAQDQIAEAATMFEELPASIREKHGNDPANFLGWIQDPKNREAILEAGFSVEHFTTDPLSTVVDAPPNPDTPPQSDKDTPQD